MPCAFLGILIDPDPTGEIKVMQITNAIFAVVVF
jgi:hypothetical protein